MLSCLPELFLIQERKTHEWGIVKNKEDGWCLSGHYTCDTIFNIFLIIHLGWFQENLGQTYTQWVYV